MLRVLHTNEMASRAVIDRAIVFVVTRVNVTAQVRLHVQPGVIDVFKSITLRTFATRNQQYNQSR